MADDRDARTLARLQRALAALRLALDRSQDLPEPERAQIVVALSEIATEMAEHAGSIARGRLRREESSANLRHVTDAELQQRGRQIAKGWAKKSKDRLWKAIVASKWGSQEVYARDRLGKAPSSLSAYRTRGKGGTACPRPVADMVKADFGIGYDYWPHGVAD